MLFLMFNEKYLSTAIMKSGFPDPFFSLVRFVVLHLKALCKTISTLFYIITKAKS